MDAELRARLRQVKILVSLEDAELDRLGANVVWRRVSAGEEVVSHLDAGGDVYFAAEGAFRARLSTAAGRQIAIRHLPAGSHFGEIAALTGAPRSLTIFAESDGLIGACPREAFLAVMRRNGEFALAVAAHLAGHLVSLTDRVFELAALEVRFRIYAELLRLAAGGRQTAEGLLIPSVPTHETIAASVGTQREAVTRELRTLAREGLLRQNGRQLILLDVERLRELVRRRAGHTTSEALDWRV